MNRGSAESAIWAVHDGREGNRAQALGLAEAVARRVEGAEVRDVALKPGRLVRLTPSSALWRAGAREGSWPFTLYEGVPEGAPRLAIGAGRRVAPLVAALGRVRGARTIQCLDPKMPPAAFDRLVVPRHDGLEGPGVIQTLGSVHRVTPERVAAALAALPDGPPWATTLAPGPRAALLIGGPSASARWVGADGARLIEGLVAVTDAGWRLVATPSRRTEPGLIAALRSALPPLALWLWGGGGPNPYPALLADAEAVVVTADSVNMASEAAATGLPVHVAPVSGLSPTIAAFHADLARHGAARPFGGGVERWDYPPLDEAGRVADLLIRDSLP